MIKQVDIHLNYPFLYKWKNRSGIYIITNADAGSYFDLFQSITNESEAFEVFENIDGNFATVINNDDFFLAAVDRVRSFPLLYKIANNKISVTDHIEDIEKEFIFNNEAADNFKKIYCTPGSETLLKNWQQVQPGEFIFIDKHTGEISLKRYFVFRNKLPVININATELKQVLLNVFQSILDKIGNKPIIVPMSAGYDSRLIITALKELNVKNIFTYTYGRRDTFEKPVAEKIAQRLSLDWRFIEYSDDLLDSFFSKKFDSYFTKNHFYTSLPCEQDFFALQYLDENNLLPENGVVLSGYLGGSFAGNRASYDFVSAEADDQQEYNFTNRGSKFIVNSIRVYEHFGLEWHMPFVATPLLDYSLHVSIRERSFENGYHNFLSEEFFKPLDIDFKKQDHDYRNNRFKNLLKKYLPQNVVKFIQSKNSSNNINDPNNEGYLKQKLLQSFPEIRKNEVYSGFNEVYSEKLLQHLHQKILFLNRRK